MARTRKKTSLSAAALCLALAAPAKAAPGITAEAIVVGMEGEV